jgi:hypothetical protein
MGYLKSPSTSSTNISPPLHASSQTPIATSKHYLDASNQFYNTLQLWDTPSKDLPQETQRRGVKEYVSTYCPDLQRKIPTTHCEDIRAIRIGRQRQMDTAQP